MQLQEKLVEFGWKHACRTASNAILYDGAEEFSFQGLILQPGMCLALEEVAFTRQRYGPVLAVAWWRRDYQEPIYLASNMDLVEEVCGWYKKRFRIGTFFADQKSRGFHLRQSHLADPKRLAKLTVAACLAYIWVVYLCTQAAQSNALPLIHRSDRCDLSLFQLGLRLLEHLLDFDLPIPVSFIGLRRRICAMSANHEQPLVAACEAAALWNYLLLILTLSGGKIHENTVWDVKSTRPCCVIVSEIRNFRFSGENL